MRQNPLQRPCLFNTVGALVLLVFTNTAGGVQLGRVENERSDEKPKLVVQLGHSQPINSVAFSRDGKYIVTGGRDPAVILWEVSSGVEIRRFPVAGAVTPPVASISQSRLPVEITSLAFSPDGKRILAGGNDKAARLWDSETGVEVWNISQKNGGTGVVAFSLDGKKVVTGGKALTEFDNITPDGTHINFIGVLDAKTGKEELTVNAGSFVATAIGFVKSKPQILFARNNAFHSREASAEKKEQWLDKTKMSLEEMDRLLPRATYLPEQDSITSADISSDGKKTAVGTSKGSVWLMDSSVVGSLRQLAGHTAQITSLAFSSNNDLIATGSLDKTIRVWDVASGNEVQRFSGHTADVTSIRISPDGKAVLSGSKDMTARLWDVPTGKELRRFTGFSSRISRGAVSSNGQYILTGAEGVALLWNLSTGRIENNFSGDSPNVIAINPDATRVFTNAKKENTVRLWDMASGAEILRFEGHTNNVISAALSSDGNRMVSAALDSTVRLWDVASGKETKRFACRAPFAVAFSPDNKYVAAGGSGGLRLWNISTGVEETSFTGGHYIVSVAFSPDGKQILTGESESKAKLWDATTGRVLKEFRGTWVSFDREGKRVVTGSLTNEVILWDIATGSQVSRFPGSAAFFSPDNQYMITWGNDRSIRVRKAQTGDEVCSLTSLGDGDWVVVTPDGRFDTNDIEKVKGMSWIIPDEPLTPLPIEIFMRDYYEPRLLPRILNGESFKPIRKLSELNRVQPGVKIAGIERQKDKPDMVTVTVEVSKASGELKQANRTIRRETGVYDLRLFRDGQIVGQSPREIDFAESPAARANNAQELAAWQKRNRIELDANSKRVIKFANVRLPRSTNVKQVEFSAYAFNEDRVKSNTDRTSFAIPAELGPKRGRAYIITVGVNAYDDPAFDLKYSVNDARSVQQTVFDRLSKRGDYEEIVQVPLISDYTGSGSQRVITQNLATKSIFKAVIDLLAGRPPDAEMKKRIPSADKLRPASPEDLVLISFSSHGYADSDGNFYFILSDTGKSEGVRMSEGLLKKMRARFLSSEELSLWLRDVDAGEMMMIVDACHSAAAVEGREFKPGPMGSRGLGQLSYDKGMRILTATQAESVALGVGALKQGLLTYALVKDGIELGKADFKPADKTITASEWLEYGERRVPKLYDEIVRGEAASDIRDLVQKQIAEIRRQQPSLFDFSRKRRDAVIVRQ